MAFMTTGALARKVGNVPTVDAAAERRQYRRSPHSCQETQCSLILLLVRALFLIPSELCLERRPRFRDELAICVLCYHVLRSAVRRRYGLSRVHRAQRRWPSVKRTNA